MPRELTYADDSADFLPADLPDTFDADDAAAEPTPRDAGRVLAELWEQANRGARFTLTLREAVGRLREEFGGRFLRGPAGREWIDPAVVEAFERRVGPTVIYDPAVQCWRTRGHGERPGRYSELR
jgi:hypothetical protein